MIIVIASLRNIQNFPQIIDAGERHHALQPYPPRHELVEIILHAG
jgi:hypothetical protein